MDFEPLPKRTSIFKLIEKNLRSLCHKNMAFLNIQEFLRSEIVGVYGLNAIHPESRSSSSKVKIALDNLSLKYQTLTM